MRKQMIESAAFEVATQVRAVEDAIETASPKSPNCRAGWSAPARQWASPPPPATRRSSNWPIAVQSLVTARGGMANCHVTLVETTQFVPGLRTVGFGDMQECPPQQARDRPAHRRVSCNKD